MKRKYFTSFDFLVPGKTGMLALLFLLAGFPAGYAQMGGGQTSPLALTLRYSGIDASGFPVIVSYVSVTDNSGFNIGALTEDHFKVYEDGVRELPITVEELTDSIGVSVVLVIDRSTSMKNVPIADAKAAAITFVKLMNDQDEAAVVSFASKVTTDHDFSRNKASLINAINGIVAKGGTALYDALIHAANMMRSKSGRRAIIFLTDGRDKDSRSTKQQALDTVVPLGVPVFTIGLNLNRNSEEEKALQEIASATGGMYYRSPSSKDLEDIYKAISALLHHVYRITYTTHNPARDGTIRHVNIEVNARNASSADTASYRAPVDRVIVALTSGDRPVPGREFTLDIQIPPGSNPVYQLQKAQFILTYDTRYLNIKQPHDQAIAFGGIFGPAGDLAVQTRVNDQKGEISITVEKKAGTGFVNGVGAVGSITFVAETTLPDNVLLTFRFRRLQLLNKDLREIPSQGVDFSVRSYGYVTVALNSTMRLQPGREFQLQVEIPPHSKYLPGMKAVSFIIKYDPTYLRVKEPVDASLQPGPLFGAASSHRLSYQVDAKSGLITIELRRKQGYPQVEGRGVIAFIVFSVGLNLPDSTLQSFEFVNLLATDESGWVIPTRLQPFSLYSYGQIVWPGDTNNNGRVELSDVNMLGIHWAIQGPGRPDEPEPLAWTPQFAGRYPVKQAAFSDADGDGRISERDLIPIGLNWGKTASSVAAGSKPSAGKIAGLRTAQSAVYARYIGNSDSGLVALYLAGTEPRIRGVVFRMLYSPASVRVETVRPGALWPVTPLLFTQDRPSEGLLAVGLVLPDGSPEPRYGTELIQIRLKLNGEAALESLRFQDAALVDWQGRTVEVPVQPSWQAADRSNPPAEFVVQPAFPNPFNPRTTVAYSLPRRGTVQVQIVDNAGRLVFERTRQQAAGHYRFEWSGRGFRGRPMPSGMYFIIVAATLEDGTRYRETQKITLLK